MDAEELLKCYEQGQKIFFQKNLTGIDLTEKKLSGINLSHSDLTEANLVGVDLQDAILRNVNFSRAKLNRANLSQTQLEGANLEEADLSGANFNGANLSQANLWKANITETIFNGETNFGERPNGSVEDNEIKQIKANQDILKNQISSLELKLAEERKQNEQLRKKCNNLEESNKELKKNDNENRIGLSNNIKKLEEKEQLLRDIQFKNEQLDNDKQDNIKEIEMLNLILSRRRFFILLLIIFNLLVDVILAYFYNQVRELESLNEYLLFKDLYNKTEDKRKGWKNWWN